MGGGGERQDPAWYAAHGITYLTGKQVGGVDLRHRILHCADGDEVHFESLIVATGARVRAGRRAEGAAGALRGL